MARETKGRTGCGINLDPVIRALSFLFSRTFLLQPRFLHLLFWVNLLGTLYGYKWYWNQLAFTWDQIGGWLLPFVPDSPTASLFFSITLLYLLRDAKRGNASALLRPHQGLSWRALWESLAVITQVKYGIWATAIIFWGASQGDTLVWQEWMLVVSHLSMAAEALIYLRFYQITIMAAGIGALWTLANDAVDYSFGVYPWLPNPLHDDVPQVMMFTMSLSVLGILCAWIGVFLARKNRF